MPNLGSIIKGLQELPPWGVYLALGVTTYVENIFPPSPSDVVMLFIATLIGIGTVELVPSIAFYIGRRYGRRLLASGRVPFLTKNAMTQVDGWFARYGYWVIVVNRFLAGTRAVISFFAGMSRLDIWRTTILCTLSALAWNGIIIWLGSILGDNWQLGEKLLTQYGQVITIILVALALFVIIRWWIRHHRSKQRAAGAVIEPKESAQSDATITNVESQ
jgi:membrane protein DedA with SNARE-associated domain